MNQNDFDTTDFLDKICESITGVKKAYISDIQGAILAESSERHDESSTRDDFRLVRSFPKYFERLSKLDYGKSQSMIVEAEECSIVFLVATPLFLTFICDKNANFSLLTELPNGMKDFFEQPEDMRTFLSKYQKSDSY